MSDEIVWGISELGRVGLTHALDPAPIAAALRVKRQAIAALFATGVTPEPLPTSEPTELLLNALVRLEVRCRGDSAAIRAAMERASPDLGGASIAQALLAEPDLAGLAAIRRAAGTLPIPAVKMWRVADTYS